MRFLANRVEPYRQRMAVLGRSLLASPKLSGRHKEIVDATIDEAYSWRFMALIVVKLPVYVIGRQLGMLQPVKVPGPIVDAKTSAEYNEYMACLLRSTAAANPLCTVVLALEMCVLLLCLLPIGMIDRLAETLTKAIVYTEMHGHNSNHHHVGG